MKTLKSLMIAVAAVALSLTSCSTKKAQMKEVERIINKTDTLTQKEFLNLVNVSSEQKTESEPHR